MRRSSSLYLLIATTILFLSCGSLQAQSIEDGKILGKLVDSTGQPIPGAQIEITSDALISGSRTTTSAENGTYVFLSVPVGLYNASASLTGFKTSVQERIPILGGTVRTVDFTMEFGEVTESVTVRATNYIIDTKNSAPEVKLGLELVQKLPTTRDAFLDLPLTAPGVFDPGKDGSWLPSPTVYGSAGNENVFLLNGVNTTNPKGGSFGSTVNVNYDTVEEVRVIDLGAKAEYGGATGASIDVTTKSGANQFHGSASYYSQLGDPANNRPDATSDLGESWLFLDPDFDIVTTSEKDREVSLTLGGPVLKDRLWFYTAFDDNSQDLKEPLWPVLLGNEGRYFDVKVSTEPAKNQSAWFAYHLEKNSNTGATWGNDVPWDATMQYGADTDVNTISSQWEWFANSKNLVSVKYLGFWTQQTPTIPEDAPVNPGYINWWKWQNFGVNGHFPYIEASDSSRHTIQGDMSTYVEDFLGQQDIKFGVQYTTGSGKEYGGYFFGYLNTAYPYRWTQDIAYTKEAYGDTGMLWYVYQDHLPPFQTNRNFTNIGGFVDDQWTLSDRLTLNLGLRFDNMTNSYGTGKVFAQPTDPHQPIRTLDVVRERQGTGNIFDFNNWSPRVGGTYEITGDGKTIARANYGRYFMPIGLENLRRLGPDMPLSQRLRLDYNIPWDQVDLNHNNFIDPEEVTATARLLKDATPISQEWFNDQDNSWQAQVAPGLQNQFSDLFTANFEREIFPDMSFSTTFIYKKTGNLLVNFPINRQTGESWEYERVAYTTQGNPDAGFPGQQVSLYSIVLKDYNTDGVINADDIQWIQENNDYEVRNMPSLDGGDASRTYKGLQFAVTKRFSYRFQMMGSFLYSDSNGPANRNNFQNWNIEGPMIMDTGFFSSLNNSINNLEGPLPFTPKYEFKLSGFYTVPKIETDFGVRLRYNSGRPYWFLEEIPQITDPESPPPSGGVIDVGTPVIVGIDPNTPALLPAATILDLQIGKTFGFAGSQRCKCEFRRLQRFQ